MRIAQSRLYNHAQFNEQSISKKLDDVSKQISSGKKIDNGYDDTTTFAKTIGLDRDISTLKQFGETAQSAKSFAMYTDSALDSMTKNMEQFKMKIMAYANSIHSSTSKEALVGELESIKSSMLNLANTKIDGKYIFGGTSTDRPPIGIGDRYYGNSEDLKITTDRHQVQNYSINGENLFLGYDKDINHRVSTNVPKLNQSALQEIPSRERYVVGTDSIKDLTGSDEAVTFYMSGTKPSGDTFKHKFTVPDTSKTSVDDLAEEIRTTFNDEVDIEIGKNGQFIITDLKDGNHKMNFHMVGSRADVTDIRDLQGQEIFEFVKSEYKSSLSFPEGNPVIGSDSVYFEKDGNRLINNVPQFLQDEMRYADGSTKLEEVSNGSLLNKEISFEGVDINGNPFKTSIFPQSDRTEVRINGELFTVREDHSEFSYRQMMDFASLSLSGEWIDPTVPLDQMLRASEKKISIDLNQSGKFDIRDLTTGESKIELAMFDPDTFSYDDKQGSTLSFHQNGAIAFDEPSVDIFDTINKAIKAVERELYHPDSDAEGFSRNRGVQGALDNLTHSIDHIVKEHTRSGAQLQSISATVERNDVLLLNAEITRNDVINVDMAEASMYFQALTLNYQAVLSTVSKVNSLSLVNYLR